MVTCVKNKFQLKKICYFWFMGSKMTREGTLAPEAIGQCIWSNMYHSFIFKVKGAYFKDVGNILLPFNIIICTVYEKKLEKPEKTRKSPKKTTGLGFFNKTRVFPNPGLYGYQLWIWLCIHLGVINKKPLSSCNLTSNILGM